MGNVLEGAPETREGWRLSQPALIEARVCVCVCGLGKVVATCGQQCWTVHKAKKIDFYGTHCYEGGVNPLHNHTHSRRSGGKKTSLSLGFFTWTG